MYRGETVNENRGRVKERRLLKKERKVSNEEAQKRRN